ncbi:MULTISPECIES: twin-arginine translocase TatA/TatE family subunit [unclassified Erythrobacter]|jgi:sec-independent protein translocase protein TatA|uniref:twin-arginine translocase TatA/TatE family subunit n=1 Tax=Erythrobacteraceae TaxID=335929 RepID=UPI00076C6452|nr:MULTISPECIES: twin-arginine translocase TatA/TatE family subunit [unclassified Erythrobacter]KWV95424.1 preprotein translocase subunit TatA [Erythrobacter sp. AP23]MBO6525749.1 twin-arginine translocase TatA/TatE family subunit [Erythrobacter sp.]MBO6529576.1 twin-arginine translocase TatA/TatE family subunit [Erythrobacter sp.]MBO6767968.1 twin-arginine translocase TatA/TatE family subunit [Erythrobacter sp.]
MGLSVWQIAIIAIVILVLFGRGRISEMMGDFGKGIKSFKQGMNDEDEAPAKQIGHEAKPADEGLTPDQVKQTTDTK